MSSTTFVHEPSDCCASTQGAMAVTPAWLAANIDVAVK